MTTQFRATALVFLGGALGSVARYAIGQTFDQLSMLFAVNILGTLALGFVNGKKRADWISSFFGAGFAGGFTTMSGVSILLALSTLAELGGAIAFTIAMLAAGFAAYLLGLRLAEVSK